MFKNSVPIDNERKSVSPEPKRTKVSVKRHDLTVLREEAPRFKNSVAIENENSNLDNSIENQQIQREFNLIKSENSDP